MRVTVDIMPVARDQLLKLASLRAQRPEDALRAAVAYCEEVVRSFTEYGAPPPGAVLRPRGDQDSWWLFADGIWLAFTREDRSVGPRPFRRTERRFTVVAAAPRPTRS